VDHSAAVVAQVVTVAAVTIVVARR
jgi:hypothetical protein